MNKPLLCVFLCALALSSAPSVQASPDIGCTYPNDSEVAALFDRWNNSLQTGDPKAVAANYSTQSVLLPTLSNTPRTDAPGRVDYFKTFLAKQPTGRVDSRTIKAGCNVALDTGTYTFTFGDNSTFQARYTFTYGLINDTWQITSHHSSAMPEAMAVAL